MILEIREREKMDKKKALFITIFLVLFSLYLYFDIGRYFTLEGLKNHRDNLIDFYMGHKILTAMVFILAYILQTVLLLPGGALLSMAGGAIFGTVTATIYVNIGATIGATFAFLLTRYLFRDFVERKFGEKLKVFNKELDKNALNYLLFLRLVPIFPFFLVNLGCGLTAMHLGTYIVGTMIGIIPACLVYTNAGSNLASVNSLSEVASPKVLTSFVLLGLFALWPVIYRKIKGPKRF